MLSSFEYHPFERGGSALSSKPRVAVGLSGGVDSTITAWLLKQEGYQVIGVTMKIWDDNLWGQVLKTSSERKKEACFGPSEKEDISLLQRLASKLNIPLYVIDLSNEYKEFVIEEFKRGYLRGYTPNPCAICNRHVKFGLMFQKLKEMGVNFQYIATGHYAKTFFSEKYGVRVISQPKDKWKDQTYIISTIPKELVEKLITPLGNYTKREVRQLALQIGLREVAHKEESQDFIEGDYRDLFSDEEKRGGPILYVDGRILGYHKGIINYTIGQRRNLNLSNLPKGIRGPLYVIRIDPSRNAIIVGEEKYLYKRRVTLKNLNFLVPPELIPRHVFVKLRYKAQPSIATWEKRGDEVILNFRHLQRAPTPGQLGVAYDEDGILLFSGIIDKAE